MCDGIRVGQGFLIYHLDKVFPALSEFNNSRENCNEIFGRMSIGA
jgi:hypothetical protein